ncbi:multicopper oxidase-domain-containing protein [Pyronema omphalodes]|nr:multicopper oxidase-domain-containing protein [Pyronema omphalodes]
MSRNKKNVPRMLATVLTTLAANLTQETTNGDSTYGTLSAPTFPKFMTNNPLPDGYPWGPLSAKYSNPYKDAPYTGVVRRYNWNIARKVLAPDGVEKEMIVVNEQFPGPTIEANWGDWIEVTVKNHLTDEGTAIHYHGLLQKATPWFDGVPSVQQCPIAPGTQLTYRFRADIYGTSWWHSHYSSQYAGGLLGPMIIHGPNHLDSAHDYDIDLGPVFLTDWYHSEYFDIVKNVMSTNLSTVLAAGVSQNNLINGKMNFDCSKTNLTCTPNAGISKFKFTPGKKHRLRIINAGAEGQQKFSIDEHNLTVIAHDFVPVEPYTVNMVSLGIGQRVDVVVDAQGDKSEYFMRSHIETACTNSTQPDALAAIYYGNAIQNVLPTSTPQPDTIPDCHQADYPLQSIVPVYKITPPEPDITHNIEISIRQNATGYWLWHMNDVSFRANFNRPILLLGNKGNFTYPQNWNVYNSGKAKNIRVILKNNSTARHPMHLHGHNMHLLAEGTGDWDNRTIINPSNPARRDTFMIKRNGYYVFQYEADNPGVWPFHCHIAWHVSAGLYVNLMERPSDIERMHIPQIMHQTCRDWWAFSNTTVIQQIDSGL